MTESSLAYAEIPMEVPFHDVDTYRIVWHGNYAKYFEVVRCKLLGQLEISYEQMEALGYFFPVIDLRVRYVKPLVFGQRVRVTAQLKSWKSKLLIDYRIFDGDSGELLTKGHTAQVAISPSGVIQYQAPASFVEVVERALTA